MRVDTRIRHMQVCATLGAPFTAADFASAAGFSSGRAIGASARILRELSELGFLLRTDGEYSMSALGRREAGIEALSLPESAQTIATQSTASLTPYVDPSTGVVWTHAQGWIFTWDASRSTWFPFAPVP